MSQLGSVPCVVGILYRKEFRRLLERYDAKFSEDKGWLDSQFVVHWPNEILRAAIFRFSHIANQ